MTNPIERDPTRDPARDVEAPDVAALRAHLDLIGERWEQVLQGAVTRRAVRIAGIDIDIVVGGDALARILLPGFACHPAALGAARGTVGAWDAAATGVSMPERIGADDGLPFRVLVRRDGRPVAEIEWDSYGSVRTADRVTRRHLLGVPTAALLSPWEAGAPLRRQLSWVLSPDVVFVHAAAVGSPDGAALVMGASGAGKSTTALSCLAAGMGFVGDDYCLLRDGDPPTVHVLHSTARVHDTELANLGALAQPVVFGRDVPENGAKSLLLVHELAPLQVLHAAPVRAVLLPEVVHAEPPGLRRVTPAEALRAVAPSALWQMHLEPERELRGLRRLLATVPAYRLLLSPQRDQNPVIVGDAITGRGARVPG